MMRKGFYMLRGGMPNKWGKSIVKGGYSGEVSIKICC